MAATTYTDTVDAGPMSHRLRSLSPVSYPGNPNPLPSPILPVASPLVPATPTNSPTASPRSLIPLTRSPSLASPPANTPETASNLDSGVASPTTGLGPAFQFHPPDFLRAHHFHSPLLCPTVPPNSPVNWHIAGDATMSLANEDVHTSLDERLAALDLARPGKDGFTNAEVRILKTEIPKGPDNEFYEIRAVPGKGYGCFAKESIKQGTRILADDPLLIVPIAEYYETHIKDAFSKLSAANQALYFTLHSAHGQDPNNWPKHIHPNVETLERCRIEEQHKARVAKDPSLISIFQTNCMEMEGGAAVFPHAARFNHSCNPNACFTWNPRIQKETIHAMRDIEKDEQITLAYCDVTHDKATRRWELKHYGFFCDCLACSGDESDPDSFATKSALRRFRLTDLEEGFKKTRGSYLEVGANEEGFVARLLEYAKLLREEGDHTIRLANTYMDMALVCERNGDFRSAKLSALKALKVKIDSQGVDSPDVEAYRAVVQRIKKRMA